MMTRRPAGASRTVYVLPTWTWLDIIILCIKHQHFRKPLIYHFRFYLFFSVWSWWSSKELWMMPSAELECSECHNDAVMTVHILAAGAAAAKIARHSQQRIKKCCTDSWLTLSISVGATGMDLPSLSPAQDPVLPSSHRLVAEHDLCLCCRKQSVLGCLPHTPCSAARSRPQPPCPHSRTSPEAAHACRPL